MRHQSNVIGTANRNPRLGLESKGLRPDLDIDVHHISSIFALSDAFAVLEAGVVGRS